MGVSKAKGDPFLKAKKVSKRYGDEKSPTVALDSVNLTIHEAEVVSIVGQSGSGKSTLLHLLSGLDAPTSGTVLFKGRDISKATRRERANYRLNSVGFIFQFFNLIPNLTAYDNAILPAVLHRDANNKSAFVYELFDMVGLSSKVKSLPSELSGGEQQRVAIIRALVNRPQVIFADEPTGNLDSKTGRSVLDLLMSCSSKFGQTVVFATHELSLAAMADRRIELSDGKTVVS